MEGVLKRANQFTVAMAALGLFGCSKAEVPSLADRVEGKQITANAYGAADVERAGNHVTIKRTAKGGSGLMVNLGPDAGETSYSLSYTVTADGRVTLRTTEDDKRVYKAGDTGRFRLGGKSTEALIYSDDANTIDITFGEAVDCSSSDEWFCYTFERMRREMFPNGEPTDRHEHLLAVLDWVSNNADMSDFPQHNVAAKALIASRTAPEMYADAYKNSRVGGYCGVTAVFMRKVLEEFGYEAVTIDFGDTEHAMTHVTTAVYDPANKHFYIVDPTFNFILTRPDGSWAPISDVISGRPVTIFERPANHDQLVPVGSARGSAYNDCTKNGDVMVCKHAGDNLARYMRTHAAALAELGIEPEPEAILALLRRQVYHVSGGREEIRDALWGILADT